MNDLLKNFDASSIACPPSSFAEMEEAMRSCEQTQGQSVWQHGESVRDHFCRLVSGLKGSTLGADWRVPEWFECYRDRLSGFVRDEERIGLYTLYHDCGKPYCRVFDGEKTRFPNHQFASAWVWDKLGGRKDVMPLILYDMEVHTASAERIDSLLTEGWSHEDSVILLLAALAEVHSNSRMFGGLNSDSFKIKWKKVERRGKQICNKLFVKTSD